MVSVLFSPRHRISVSLNGTLLLLAAFCGAELLHTRQVAAQQQTSAIPLSRAIGGVRAMQVIEISEAVDVAQFQELINDSNVSGITSDGAEADTESDSEMLAGLTDEQKEAVKSRLEQLWVLPLNRTPSAILEQWGKDQAAALGKSDDQRILMDIPPGSPVEDLLDDERFVVFTTRISDYVQSGRWDELKSMIGFFDQPLQRRLFQRILASMAETPAVDPAIQQQVAAQGTEVDPVALERQFLVFSSFFELLEISPDRPLKNSDLQNAGTLAAQILASGCSRASLLDNVREQVARPSESRLLDEGAAARLLFYSGMLDASGEFLPRAEDALAEKDFSTMNFICEQMMAVYAKEGKTETLEQVWRITRQIVESEGVPSKQLDVALSRAVSLAVKIRSELGEQWLNESFTSDPARGIRILAAIGRSTLTSMMTEGARPEKRRELLKLQKEAVQALLGSSVEIQPEWAKPLELMALAWLRESEITYKHDKSTSSTPDMRRDMYGNIFYMGMDDPYADYGGMGGLQYLKPVPTGELMETSPGEPWLEFVAPSLRPQFDVSLARLYLKVNEAEKALPYIESLANTYPDIGKDLVSEFLRVWTTNHDPNSDRGRSDYYMYMYGYESRAESIPLTRSKQQRNLEELSNLIPRLKAIGDGKLDQKLVSAAFLTCHSYAEVFHLSDIERVFGQFDSIEPEVIGSLAETMRANLASVWRQLETQQNAKTKRNQNELIAEVIRGYEVARSVVERGLTANPDNWNLLLTKASLLLDSLNYQSGLKRDSSYAERHHQSMDYYQRAAKAYAARVPGLENRDYSTEVFEKWFYACLGASDLNLVESKHNTDEKQILLIREALESLPGESAEWHMSRFANLMFNRLSNCQPAIKFRYLDAGFRIVGDNPQARKAREVFDYYRDLVTEIRLVAMVDGPIQVGQEPFGIFVNLEHTTEIERESNGFSKYLQNQNSGSGFYYNYGRPTEDYRDRFEEHVREKLGESFDVMSVTFQVPEVQSRPMKTAGWRVTPYAYVLLKSKGSEVDQIPRMKLDLDFLDTSGYAVLPVESPPIAIDSAVKSAPARPWSDLSITQILDERQASEGKLIVEIKANARGIVPNFREIFGDKPDFGAFESTGEIADDGVSVTQFDPSADDNVVTSERAWTLTLSPKSGTPAVSQEFRFLNPILNVSELAWQQYDDADLKEAAQVVVLNETFRAPVMSQWWKWLAVIITGLVTILCGLIGWSLLRNRPPRSKVTIPENLSPFSLITMLRQIASSGALTQSRKSELAASIDQLQNYYFASNAMSNGNGNGTGNGHEVPDLNRIAHRWLTREHVEKVTAGQDGRLVN